MPVVDASGHHPPAGDPTTSPARTALDLAPRLSRKALTRLVNNARHDGHLRPASLQDVITRNRYHPGAKLLRPFAEHTGNPTNSSFEDDFLAFIAEYGLPTPQINIKINGRQADAFFPEHNLIVECDGWEFHKDRQAFEDDRERDAEQLRHGIPTVRITKERLNETRAREATRLQDILQSRGAGQGPSWAPLTDFFPNSERFLTGTWCYRDTKSSPIQETTRP